MSKKAVGFFAILFLVLLGLSSVLNVFLLASFALRPDTRAPGNFRQVELYAGNSEDTIVHIDVQGMITSFGGSAFFADLVTGTKRRLEAAAADSRVKAIVLRINSPGGEITASDNIFNAVRTAASKKPVVVYMDSVGASGGYYIACGGSYLMANETTVTGSIGVIIQTLNYRELLGKVGLESIVFTSGKFKDMLSPSRPIREEERAYVQKMVDAMYERFVGIVSEARQIPLDELKNGIADGRILTGEDALEAKLIDATGYIEDAYAQAKILGNAPNARIVKYGEDVSLGSLLGFLGKSSSQMGSADVQRVKLELDERFFPKLQPGAVYLLPEHFAY